MIGVDVAQGVGKGALELVQGAGGGQSESCRCIHACIVRQASRGFPAVRPATPYPEAGQSP
jgi:hypothetical protein